jgi:hypothetical protein
VNGIQACSNWRENGVIVNSLLHSARAIHGRLVSKKYPSSSGEGDRHETGRSAFKFSVKFRKISRIRVYFPASTGKF